MRVPVFDAICRWAVILVTSAAVVAVTSSVAPAAAQMQQQPATGIQNQPIGSRPVPGGPPGAGNEDDPMMRHMSAQLAKTRNNLRQQQLVTDSAKLLELATQLKTEVDKSNQNTLSLTVVKKAEEIEKLAKSVKEKMRDAQ
jgi:hypothetical protein